MNKAYNRINWENYPSDKTPLNENNLNKIDSALDEVDNRVIEQETTKATKTEVATLVADVTFEESTGIITVTRKNGSSFIIDTKLEKIAINFTYDKDTQQIILTLVDGTKQYIDLSALITQYEFLDSDTITFVVQSDGSIKAEVLDGSITENKLQTNYLATIKVNVAKAEASSTAAATSEANALASENAAKISETNAKTSETNAKNSEENASTSADTASAKATEAGNSANAAATSAKNASSSAITATNKATEAVNSATSASKSADTATNKASEASTSATNSNTYATKSQSYAVGGTGTRENEDIDNAEYYYQQSKAISESFSGALRPMGTVTFANLPSLSSATEGDMYNISDQFVTTADFKEGSGLTIPSGSNVYKTSDGYWDVLAGSPVTGVKGNAESSYRKGNVNITPENIGLGNVPNVSTNDQTPTFTQASARANISSGEKLSVIFGKIMKFFADIKTVAFSGSYADLSNKPSNATSSADGFMSKTDKSKLDGIATGAQVNSITGVKGNTEYSYRTGNVNLTPANLGALASNGDSKSNTVTFTSNDVEDGSATSWTSVTKLASGISHATFFQRVSQMFKNVRYLYKVLGTTDISAIGDGTVSGAISTLNSNLNKLLPTTGTVAFVVQISNKTVLGGTAYVGTSIYVPKGYTINVSDVTAIGASGNFASSISWNRYGDYYRPSTTNANLAGYTLQVIATLS